MYKILPLIACFVIQTIVSFAQSDFSPGYVVLKSNDTINGFIDLRNSTLNYQLCRFKQNNQGDIIEYSPKDINAYFFNIGKYYISKAVDFNSTIDTVFVEFLVDGEIKMYLYKDKNNSYYLFEKEGYDPIFLSDKEVHTQADDGRIYVKDKISNRGALIYYLKEHPELHSKIHKLKLDQQYLIPIIVEYSNFTCPDKTCIVYAKKLKTTYSLGPIVGLNRNDIKFGGAGFLIEQSVVNSLQYGLHLDVCIPTVHKRIFNSFSLLYSENEHGGPGSGSYAHIRYSNLNFTFSLYYCYNHYRIQPLIGLGVYGSVALPNTKIFDDNRLYNAHKKRLVYAPLGLVGLKYKVSDNVYLKSTFEMDFLSTDIIFNQYFYTITSNRNISFSVLFNL
jgi:hypothetical protein